MALYAYKAMNTQGRMVLGRLEAINLIDLEMRLKRMDLDFINGDPVKQGGLMNRGKITRQELINFCFHLEQLARAGVALIESLTDLRDTVDNPRFREILAGMIESIEGGKTLSQAMAEHPQTFDEVIVSLIRSGEVTGQLPEVLKEIVRSLRWQDEMAAHTKKLLAYPLFVMVVLGGVVSFLMIYLVPQLIGFLTNLGQGIPFQTRLLIAVSGIFVNYWWAIFSVPPVLFAAVLSLSAASPAVRFRLHDWQMRVPVIGPVLKKMTMARFADTLGLMYRTGIPLIEGLRYCEGVSNNVVIQGAIVRARERVLTGTPMSESFAAEQLFPPFVIRMLKVGESTGALDASLANISYFYSRDIDESIARVQAMIEPALTVIMGLILGWIMLAVLGPIYDTISKMKT